MRFLKKPLLVLVTLLFPLLAVTSSIRLALTPLYINLEYRLPGFPADTYGFSTQDRLKWGQYSIDYLLGKIPHAEFSSQIMPDGAPLFNSREITHMLDVRNLTGPVISIWIGLCIFFLAAIWFSAHKEWKTELLQALKNGAILTILLIFTILLLVWMNFDLLFTEFHQLFFEGDTWLFYLSDNLIRLFPMRFWRDLFIFIGFDTLILCLIPILLHRNNFR